MQQECDGSFNRKRFEDALRRDLDHDHAMLLARDNLDPPEQELLWMLARGANLLRAELARKSGRNPREDAILEALRNTDNVREARVIADQLTNGASDEVQVLEGAAA
ncbi:MAG: hypothetical protein AAB489_05130 [Patescibacteria group bacterium]